MSKPPSETAYYARGWRRLQLRLPADVLAKLNRGAKARGISRATLVGMLITACLKGQEK